MPSPHDPSIGADEWVARIDERRTAGGTWQKIQRRVPTGVAFAGAIAVASVIPLLISSDYAIRVGVNTLVFAILAIGLNIEVGWVGALDLGYIALFGLGAYFYAFAASSQFGAHWPSIVAVPVVALATAIIAVLVGLTGRRLVGDYYAIATLFFAQAFITVANNADRISPPFVSHAVDFTGGPNGILNVDPFEAFGVRLDTVRGQYYFALAAFALIAVAIYLVNHSRIGRSWRAMNDDLLAAELMGMPTEHLRLLALAFGGAIAGVAGATFATVQAGVFPANFDLALLITIYAMIIFGGAGSMVGVVAGVLALNVTLEFLRNPNQARLLFYGAVLLAVVRFVRPWWCAVAILMSTLVFGGIVRGLGTHLLGERIAPAPPDSGRVVGLVDRWVIVLQSHVTVGNIAYVALFAAAIALTRVGRALRLFLLPPTIYLAAFVWENRLADNPGVTRLLALGAILVVFMNLRPRGLLGRSQVDIV